ncbi:unnamed protein product [Schistosoma haematobium]|nr:unnamed protein product [Schistosoma haematobium]
MLKVTDLKKASSSEVSKINLETQVCELESQLNAEKRKSEENMKDIQFRLQAANEEIDQLKKENAELREASKIQRDNLMKIRSLAAQLEDEIECLSSRHEQTRRRHYFEVRARKLGCKQRIETIEAAIRQKNVLLISLEAAAEQGDESYCLLLNKYESQIRELESKVIDFEQERSKLLAEHSNEELKE